MIRELHGDLIQYGLDGEFDVINHGCNCFCTMGVGIAKKIKCTFPEAFRADCATTQGDKSKLGSYSSAILIVNAYTQFDYKGRGTKADYKAISQYMGRIAADPPSLRMGMPQIGAGLAGGDWPTIFSILSQSFERPDATIVYYQPQTEQIGSGNSLGCN